MPSPPRGARTRPPGRPSRPGLEVRRATPPARVVPGQGPAPGREQGRQPNADAAAVRRAVTLLTLTALAPGSAQSLDREHPRRARLGRVVLRVWAGLLGLVSLLALAWFVHEPLALWFVTRSLLLRLAAVVLLVVALAWPVLVLDAWRLGHPPRLPVTSRRWVAGLAATLVVLTCALPLLAGRRVWAAADLVSDLFGDGRRTAAIDGRYTVLLLGADSGPTRLGARPDSVTLASIDENNGRTVLFSLPRNLQNIPFPPGTPAAKALPNGWSCGDECLLNAVYQWGQQHAALFPGATDPGAEAMKQAVHGITGLPVNYYVMVDLKGFRALIDAVGGIDLVVSRRVPIGGGTSPIFGWIKPGTQNLNGFEALWYARSREGSSDYERMQRQRCVMTAMVNQLDSATVARRFQKIADAGKQVVRTDIPAGQLPTFITLGQQAKQSPVASVQFVPPLTMPHRPDYAALRERVRAALDAGPPAAVTTTRATLAPSAGASPRGGRSGRQADDARQVCSAA